MFALIPTLGFQEMFVIIVLGVLLFGRNLPDVGKKLGRTVANLRRGMQEFKDQMDRDDSIRELRDSVRDVQNEVRRVGAMPRAIANPGGALRDLAQSTIAEADSGAEPDGEASRQAPAAASEPADANTSGAQDMHSAPPPKDGGNG